VAERGVADAVAGSFLGRLPSDLVDTLLELGEIIDYPPGTMIYREGSYPRTLLVVDRVGSWFQYLFWIIGAFSLFAAALGIVDYTSRLAADVIKTSYARNANESKVYAVLVWGLVLIGMVVLLAGFSQPIVLLVISAVVGGFMMFIYSALLILINRRILPAPIRIRGVRLGALVWSFVLFGVLSVLTFADRVGELFD
jgi:MFS family permease